MPRVMVDLNRSAPTQVSYREYDEFGLPLINSTQPYSTSRILQAETSVCVRAGFGNFDTALPDQTQFDRTLHEVLAKAGAGEFKIISQSQQWIRCDKFGVRLLRYVEWLEYSRRPATDVAAALTTTQFLRPAL